MHKHVEALIGRLATDPALQRRFAEQPMEVLHELRLELTAIEREALAAVRPEALRAFTEHLDSRLVRASHAEPGASTTPAQEETSR